MIDFVLVPLIVLGLALSGLRLRARVPAALPAAAGEPQDHDWAVVAAVTVDDATRREAAAYARAEGLDMVDLVPPDLPEPAARDLLRRVDPRSYRTDRFARVRSAGAATLLDPELLKQAGATEPADPQPADVIALDRRVKAYACGTAAVMLAPRLHSGGDDLAKRRARLRANGVVPPIHLALDVIPYALTVIALAAAWQWGLVAAVVYCLQPYLIFAGTGIRPRGLHAAALLRPVHDPYVWVRTAAGRWRSSADAQRAAQLAESAAYHAEALAGGTDPFFGQRREDCPWCGSRELTLRLRSSDLVTHKPGTFTLDRCTACGHIFQNPRLTTGGLDFYYRDTYDGIGGGMTEAIFWTGGAHYRRRARMLQPFTTPRNWLDVGTGYAHFCAVASEVWPDTVFDGLDLGDQVEQAQRRGWISTAHRGLFPDVADRLTGRYDVISMHHYLEHTTEPLAELDAAAAVLPAGGYLLIELPDPQWRVGRLFGKFWMPWFQPQHLNLMPVGNLVGALAERGLRTVATERASAHQNNDFTVATVLFFSSLTFHRSWPWSQRPPTAVTRAWDALVWTVGVPAVALGLAFDFTLGQLLPPLLHSSNAYRVLARKQEPPDGN